MASGMSEAWIGVSDSKLKVLWMVSRLSTGHMSQLKASDRTNQATYTQGVRGGFMFAHLPANAGVAACFISPAMLLRYA